jgi:hypothetical protein
MQHPFYPWWIHAAEKSNTLAISPSKLPIRILLLYSYHQKPAVGSSVPFSSTIKPLSGEDFRYRGTTKNGWSKAQTPCPQRSSPLLQGFAASHATVASSMQAEISDRQCIHALDDNSIKADYPFLPPDDPPEKGLNRVGRSFCCCDPRIDLRSDNRPIGLNAWTYWA